MALLHISHKFRSTKKGLPIIELPSEWTPALIDIDIPVDQWLDAKVYLQGQELEMVLRKIDDGSTVVVAEWPRSGPGNFRLEIRTVQSITASEIKIIPSKISEDEYNELIDELESTLPASIAIALNEGGALGGIDLADIRRSTLDEQVLRLRRAVLGTDQQMGLAGVLPRISESPHRVLVTDELWVRQELARRPQPHRFPQALIRAGNLDSALKPLQIIDSRVNNSFDVYENRLLKLFTRRVISRLNSLVFLLSSTNKTALLEEVEALLDKMRRSMRAASFLDQVRDVPNVPNAISMVFLKEPRYRAALDRYLEYKKYFGVTIEEPAMDAPLNNLPYLYQFWSTLVLIQTLITAAKDLGYRVESQRLFKRGLDDYLIELIPNGNPALVLKHDVHDTTVSLIPEYSFTRTGNGYRSVSFTQRPDVAIIIERPGEISKIILFDPKYKLDHEDTPQVVDATSEVGSDDDAAPGTPKKIDVDKMHAYSDSIRSMNGDRVVVYAGILYPGKTTKFSESIQAIRAIPGDDREFRRDVTEILNTHMDA